MSSTATLDPMITRESAVIRSAARPARPAQVTVPVRPAVRLTRRGRLVVVVLVAFLALSVAVIGASSVFAASPAPAKPRTTTVVVQPGQTLWEVAAQVGPDRDLRDVVKQISDLNALPSSLVAPGQSLVVPVS